MSLSAFSEIRFSVKPIFGGFSAFSSHQPFHSIYADPWHGDDETDDETTVTLEAEQRMTLLKRFQNYVVNPLHNLIQKMSELFGLFTDRLTQQIERMNLQDRIWVFIPNTPTPEPIQSQVPIPVQDWEDIPEGTFTLRIINEIELKINIITY